MAEADRLTGVLELEDRPLRRGASRASDALDEIDSAAESAGAGLDQVADDGRKAMARLETSTAGTTDALQDLESEVEDTGDQFDATAATSRRAMGQIDAAAESVSDEMSRLEREADQVDSSLGGVSDQAQSGGSAADRMSSKLGMSRGAMVGLTAAAGGAAFGIGALGAEMIDTARRTTRQARQTERLAETVNASVVEIQQLRTVYQRAGADQDQLRDNLFRLSERLDEARRNAGGMRDDFLAAGITMDQLKNDINGPVDALEVLADRIRTSDSRVEALRASEAILGGEAQRLTTFLRSQDQTLRELMGSASDYGAILDQEAVAAQSRAYDSVERLMGSWESLKTSLVTDWAPEMVDAIEAVEDASEALNTRARTSNQILDAIAEREPGSRGRRQSLKGHAAQQISTMDDRVIEQVARQLDMERGSEAHQTAEDMPFTKYVDPAYYATGSTTAQLVGATESTDKYREAFEKALENQNVDQIIAALDDVGTDQAQDLARRLRKVRIESVDTVGATRPLPSQGGPADETTTPRLDGGGDGGGDGGDGAAPPSTGPRRLQMSERELKLDRRKRQIRNDLVQATQREAAKLEAKLAHTRAELKIARTKRRYQNDAIGKDLKQLQIARAQDRKKRATLQKQKKLARLNKQQAEQFGRQMASAGEAITREVGEAWAWVEDQMTGAAEKAKEAQTEAEDGGVSARKLQSAVDASGELAGNIARAADSSKQLRTGLSVGQSLLSGGVSIGQAAAAGNPFGAAISGIRTASNVIGQLTGGTDAPAGDRFDYDEQRSKKFADIMATRMADVLEARDVLRQQIFVGEAGPLGGSRQRRQRSRELYESMQRESQLQESP